MTKRHQRFRTFLPLQWGASADQDSISYEPGSSKITLGVFPRFNSGLPDIPKIEVPLRSGAKAPPKLPFSRGGFAAREINNEPYYIYCVGLSGALLEVEKGIPLTNYQCVAAVAKRNGDIVAVIVGDGDDVSENHSSFAKYAIWKMDFDRKARPIESKNLITKINEVDTSTLTHTYVTTIRIPGGGEYRIAGNVREGIRNRGGVPNGSFSYWRRAWTWQDGDLVAMVAEDFSEAYHVAVFGTGGQFYGDQANCNGLQNAIMTANHILDQNRK